MMDDYDDEELAALVKDLSPDEIEELLEDLPDPAARALLNIIPASREDLPATALAQALELDDGYRVRAHLEYLSERLAKAVEDVENGQSRNLVISMPPRLGKSTLASQYLPTWLLRQHPEWKIGMISHDSSLAVTWGRAVRRFAENRPELGIRIAPDAGAAQEWETREHGGILARSVGGSITGRGFKVLLIDDPVKDFVTAHSEVFRKNLWEWWLSTAQTRLEPPSLTIVIGTRWHEDDFIGRLLSDEHEGDPDEWEVLSFPALADEESDVLGRELDEPLISPLIDETTDEAVQRWAKIKKDVGSYTWDALYQQKPSAPKGAIFDVGWWRYWTTDPKKVTDDGRVILFDPDDHSGTWVESWDCAFKDTKESDYVVGQRWVRREAQIFLTQQVRGRWSFTKTLPQMEAFSAPWVSARLVEDKANGSAILDTMRRTLTGLIPINPRESKEARARAVSPLIEAGNVHLPYPSEPGCAWVSDLITETRNFPTGSHDDQVDSMTQALFRLRLAETARKTRPPNAMGRRVPERATGGSMRIPSRSRRA